MKRFAFDPDASYLGTTASSARPDSARIQRIPKYFSMHPGAKVWHEGLRVMGPAFLVSVRTLSIDFMWPCEMVLYLLSEKFYFIPCNIFSKMETGKLPFDQYRVVRRMPCVGCFRKDVASNELVPS